MNRTSVEWIFNPNGSRPGWSWNPVTGCLNNCNYCFARRLANGRLKARYLANKNVAPLVEGWYHDLSVTKRVYLFLHGEDGYVDSRYDAPFYPRFWSSRLDEDLGICRGIFVADMGDLFGVGVPEGWTKGILDRIRRSSHRNRYYLLTKQPQNLVKFSPFSDNCWVGVTATDCDMAVSALTYLHDIRASVKYLSLEPLLKRIPLSAQSLEGIDWLIIGALTGMMWDLLPLRYQTSLAMVKLNGSRWSLQPQIEWVKEIVEAAGKAGIPIFEKENLKPLLQRELIQELPK